MVKRVEFSGQRVCETGIDPDGRVLKTLPLRRSLKSVKAYVTIMQGCDQFCSYCIVPYVRGRERSRSSTEILEEVRHLASLGVKEVCLLGQNVNGYGKKTEGEPNFPSLLGLINEVERIERIRFITSPPRKPLGRVDRGIRVTAQVVRTHPASLSIRVEPNLEGHAPGVHKGIVS